VLRVRARYIYRFTLIPRLLVSLPLAWAYGAGRRLGRFRYRRHRPGLAAQAAEMQARLGASPKQVDKWLERCFELAVCEDLDWPLFARMGEDRLGSRVMEVVGREHLDESLALGRGVVIYSGHFFGHFTAPVALAQLGYRMNVAGLFRNLQDPDEDQWYPRRRQALVESLGCRLIRMHEQGIGATRGAIVALRANEVVMTLIDHTPMGQMVETSFLGVPGFFPSGPAWLARMTGAPLVFFDVRRPEGQLPQRMELGAPYWVEDDVEAAVAHMAANLEAAVRADPPSWGPWLYPRKYVWSPLGSRSQEPE
jgi:KDO2-lipid IV(A) lauroyltransferase